MENEKEKDKKTLLKKKRNISKDKDQNSPNLKENIKKNNIIIRTTKKPNRKRLLKNKLEFFLSDVNLYHDKYLKKIYLSHNESVSPETFLTFNSIKKLLSDIDKMENKKNVIIKAVEISNKLKYDKITNKIKRVIPYKEKLINNELYDKCTLFIENFPPIINHTIIYDLFKDYKILYISLLKGKNSKLNGQAFIILKNIEDIPKIIENYNNTVPKQISSLNPKELKPLKIITKENYNKNNISEDIVKNSIKNSNNEIKNKNIDNNTCIKIKNINENINLNNIKNCLSNIITPLFIDINRKDKIIILRFESKKESNIFLEKCKETNYDCIKNFLNLDEKENNNILVEELNEEERIKYINFVKKEIENFKEKKEKKKKEKNKKFIDDGLDSSEKNNISNDNSY